MCCLRLALCGTDVRVLHDPGKGSCRTRCARRLAALALAAMLLTKRASRACRGCGRDRRSSRWRLGIRQRLGRQEISRPAGRLHEIRQSQPVEMAQRTGERRGSDVPILHRSAEASGAIDRRSFGAGSGGARRRFPADPGEYPAEIQKLVDTAQAGDQVVLLLAGHGGQQPEHNNTDPTYAKPDGLDQMFLPCDCGHWISRSRCVERAIVDYQLRDWCKRITAKKARLWVVLDACCSGWMLRDGTVSRRLTGDDLGIPSADIEKARDAAQARLAANRGAAGCAAAMIRAATAPKRRRSISVRSRPIMSARMPHSATNRNWKCRCRAPPRPISRSACKDC